MKLELKHLAPYLPHKLGFYGAMNIWELLGIDSVDNETGEIFLNLMMEFDSDAEYLDDASSFEFSPILRPLSDLTKVIEVNGDEFIPNDRVCLYGETELCDLSVKDIPYKWMARLFEWHFDVFGLIEKGLAVDINNI